MWILVFVFIGPGPDSGKIVAASTGTYEQSSQCRAAADFFEPAVIKVVGNQVMSVCFPTEASPLGTPLRPGKDVIPLEKADGPV